MKIYIEKTNEFKDIEARNIKDIFLKLEINPTTVIIIKNNELVTEDSEISANDEIKILSVISGG